MEERSLAEAVESTGLLEAVEHDLSVESAGAIVDMEGSIIQQLNTVQDANLIKLAASDDVKTSEEHTVMRLDTGHKRQRVAMNDSDVLVKWSTPSRYPVCRLGAVEPGHLESILGEKRKTGKSNIVQEGVQCDNDSSDVELHISEKPSTEMFAKEGSRLCDAYQLSKADREELLTVGGGPYVKEDYVNNEAMTAVAGYFPHKRTTTSHLDSSIDVPFHWNMASGEDMTGSCRPGEKMEAVMQVKQYRVHMTFNCSWR